jgi:hypothetical protein
MTWLFTLDRAILAASNAIRGHLAWLVCIVKRHDWLEVRKCTEHLYSCPDVHAKCRRCGEVK